MKLQKLYLESISHLSRWDQVWCLKEAPHARLDSPEPPDGVPWLRGFMADLGFENYPLPKHQKWQIQKAFGGPGVKIPGTTYTLRFSAKTTIVVEPNNGDETITLPEDWPAYAYTIGSDNVFIWVGDKVRPDQLPGVDLSGYVRSEYGYMAN